MAKHAWVNDLPTEPGWDSYNAPIPNEKAIENAKRLMGALSVMGEWTVGATAAGGIAMIHDLVDGGYLFIEALNSGFVGGIVCPDECSACATLRAEIERLRAAVEKASRDLRLYDVADRLARAEQAARLVIQTAEAITDESAAARTKGGSDGE